MFGSINKTFTASMEETKRFAPRAHMRAALTQTSDQSLHGFGRRRAVSASRGRWRAARVAARS